MLARLAPLLGVAGRQRGRAESFAAWRGFLQAVAERGPLILAFEDLHWADTALLEFIEQLTDWVEGVPLLLVCTARPELFERHADLRSPTPATPSGSTSRRSARPKQASSSPAC